MLKEFRQFALKDNVVDLALGIIIGAAFTGIVNSLVGDVLMPPIGLLLGGIDFSNYYLNLTDTAVASLDQAKREGVPVIAYDLFANAILKFCIVAFALFLVVKQVKRLMDDDALPPEQTPPTRQEVLLSEIRDLLAGRTRG